MSNEVEISALDLRYQGYRMKNAALEGRLLVSIAQRGIEEPLEGVPAGEQYILLNGFKRYRCARQLPIPKVPYASLGPEEGVGILNLLRISNTKALGLLLACSGHPLSVREIELLAHGFVRGPESFRQQILSGNLALPLKRLKEVPADPEGCSEFERLMLRDLELIQEYLQRVLAKSLDQRLASRNFHAQCHLLTNNILSRATAFLQTLRKLPDRSGQT